MGVSHSLDREQMKQLVEAFRLTSTAMVQIEKRTRTFERYLNDSSKTQERLGDTAKEVVETIESLNNVMNEKGEAAHLSWNVLSQDTKHHANRALKVFANLKFDRISKEAPKELAPLMIPIFVFMLVLGISNSVFGFLLTSSDRIQQAYRHRESEEDSGSDNINILLSAVVWVHLLLIGFLVTWLFLELYRNYKNKKRKEREKARSTGMGKKSFFTLLGDILKQPMRPSFFGEARNTIDEDNKWAPGEQFKDDHEAEFSDGFVRSTQPTGDSLGEFNDEYSFPIDFASSDALERKKDQPRTTRSSSFHLSLSSISGLTSGGGANALSRETSESSATEGRKGDFKNRLSSTSLHVEGPTLPSSRQSVFGKMLGHLAGQSPGGSPKHSPGGTPKHSPGVEAL